MDLSEDMTMGQLVQYYPSTIKVLFGFGMGCVGCPSSQGETIRQACDVHQIDIEELMEAIQDEVNEAASDV
jgi:hybrid cluster-associated redox disulfide protein